MITGPFSRLPRPPVSWILERVVDTREECIFVMYERRENKRTGTKASTADESSIVIDARSRETAGFLEIIICIRDSYLNSY